MKHKYKNLLQHYSFYQGGDQPHVPWLERIRSVVGAFIGPILALTTPKFFGELSELDEWLIASLGASTLLDLPCPGSCMAQPWAVIAGNTLSALVGIVIIHLVAELLLALAFTVSLSTLGMFTLRCLYPPAAAVALLVVLGHLMNYPYAFFPVMVSSILLIMAEALYCNLTGKAYPNKLG